MTVREFITAFMTKVDPQLWDSELCVVFKTEIIDGKKVVSNHPTIKGEHLDGATLVRGHPIQSVVIGGTGFFAFVDSENEQQAVIMVDATTYPTMAVVGPTPKSLKWE